jgi:hypothetical protein
MKQPAAILLLLLSLASLSGCKKFIEKKKEDALVNAMVDGQWAVTSFVYNGNNITADFSGYKFQYYENKTVDAIKDGSIEKKGSWDGDVNTMTTWASFTNVVTPLSHINGSWHIDDSGWTYVVATQATASETKVMRLDKQ